MKKMLIGLFALTSFSLAAAELTLDSCQFENSIIDFKPSYGLTTFFKEELKGNVVYNVKYKKGTTRVGPKTDMAVVTSFDKTLIISFFDFDEEGIVYKDTRAVIDLASPTSTDAPVIKFEAAINDDDMTEGECSLLF